MEKKINSKAAAKASAVKPVGKKPAARRKKPSVKPTAALPFKVKKLPLPPPKEFHDGLTTAERFAPYFGRWTDEEADEVWKAILEQRGVE
jgi:hypothetical protein